MAREELLALELRRGTGPEVAREEERGDVASVRAAELVVVVLYLEDLVLLVVEGANADM